MLVLELLNASATARVISRHTCRHATCLGYSGSILSPGPLVTSYDMPGIQWTYSIPGPLVASYDMPGIQWTYSIPRALGRLIRHAWDTVDLFYPRALGRLIRHAWDTVDLFYPPGPWSPHPTCNQINIT